MGWRVSPVTLCFPSFSFLKVAIGFLVAWFRKPYCFLSELALIGFTTDASSAPCRQARVGLLEAECFNIVIEPFQNQRPLALLVYRFPFGASVRAGSGELGKEEGHSSHFLAFLNQSSLPFLPAQPCCWFFPFLWVFALFGEQVFLCGSHFFVQG